MNKIQTLTQNLGLDKGGLSIIERESTELEEYFLRLFVYEEYFGMSWLSACYPLDPRFIYQNKKREYRILADLVEPLLKSAIPEQLRRLDFVDDDDDDDNGDVSSNDMNKKKSGESINVVSLLTLCGGDHLVRHDGERIVLDLDTFSGKHVLVCCFNVPVLWGTYTFQTLLNLCHELVSSPHNYEIVMVARMSNLADTPTVFDNFLKAFPSSCLAVPYEESKRREHICKLLNLGVQLKFRLYNTDGTHLPSFRFISDYYGAEAFPFTKEIVSQTFKKYRGLRKSRLDQLLRLRPCDSPPAVYKFNPAGGPREEVLISNQFSNKHVGLYMCCEGSLIPLLYKLYEQCRSKHKELEIVVLYCPFKEMLDSEFFKAKIDRLLQEQNVSGWWCLPFNNSVSLRFWGLSDLYNNVRNCLWVDFYDKLIIVGPDGKILDIYAAEVIKYHGIDAYPFTREAHVKKEMKKVREITLESILVADVYRGFDRRDTISAGELVSSKKKVIIYMAVLHDDRHDTVFLQGLISKYKEMNKCRSTEFEIVFINNSYEDPESRELEEVEEVDARMIKEMPWFVYPRNGKRTSSLKDLRKLLKNNGVAGFGEDGRVCSLKDLILQYALPSCFSDTLYQDLYCRFGYAYFREKYV